MDIGSSSSAPHRSPPEVGRRGSPRVSTCRAAAGRGCPRRQLGM